MDAPLCKTCGTRHWSTCLSNMDTGGTPAKRAVPPAADARLEGGKRSATLGRKATAPAPKVSAVPDGGSTYRHQRVVGTTVLTQGQQVVDAMPATGSLPPLEPAKRGRPATGFDKKAYDREQARIRRAAKKGQPK